MGSLAPLLKQKYSGKRPTIIAEKYANPWFKRITKNTNFTGDNYVFAVGTTTPQGQGHEFAEAQANKSPTNYSRFTVTTTKDYITGSLSSEAILAAKDEEGALERATKEMDNAFITAYRRVARELDRDGGGSIGRIASINTNDFTLTNLGDNINFDIGQSVRFATTSGTTGSLTAGAARLVTAVNRRTGTVTLNGTVVGGGGAVNSYVFIAGDFGRGLRGHTAWVPYVDPVAGDNFFGLDRSTDVTRLAGWRYQGLGAPIEETLIDAAAQLVAQGAMPDLIRMNPLDGASLAKAQSGRVITNRDVGSKAEGKIALGFSDYVFVTPTAGAMELIFDVNCPQGEFRMVRADSWSFKTRGEGPKLLTFNDGDIFYPNPSSDDAEFRIGWFGQVVCESPWESLTGAFGTLPT